MSDLPYRMIAIDLDGTLLSPTGTVTERTSAAIRKVLASGYMVCFATGRNFTESRSILEAVEHFDHAVFVSGAMVIDTKQRVTLHRTLMSGELARELCGIIEARGLAALALQDTASAGVDYWISQDAPLNEATRKWMTVTAAKIHFRDDLATAGHEHTVRVSIVASAEEVRDLSEELGTRFGSRIATHGMCVPAYGEIHLLEIFDSAVNKWEGILHVARRHKIEPGQIIAIGDDVNDIHMIRRAGLGVAMGNARPEVRAAAGRVIESNLNDGLAQFLEELVQEQPDVAHPVIAPRPSE